MASIPFIAVQEPRPGLFNVRWNDDLFHHLFHEKSSPVIEFQLCGSQWGRIYRLSCSYFTLFSSNGGHSLGINVMIEKMPPFRLFSNSEFQDLNDTFSTQAMREEDQETGEGPLTLTSLRLFSETCCDCCQTPEDATSLNLIPHVGDSNCTWIVSYSRALHPSCCKQKFSLVMDFYTNECTVTERNLLSGLADKFFNQAQCDVQFHFNNGQKIGAHEFVLSAGSPVFATMFQLTPAEETRNVTVDDTEFDIFKQLLVYLYTGKVARLFHEFTDLPSLHTAAAKYGIDQLMKEVIEAIGYWAFPWSDHFV